MGVGFFYVSEISIIVLIFHLDVPLMRHCEPPPCPTSHTRFVVAETFPEGVTDLGGGGVDGQWNDAVASYRSYAICQKGQSNDQLFPK